MIAHTAWLIFDLLCDVVVILLGLPVACVIILSNLALSGKAALSLLNVYKSVSVVPVLGRAFVTKIIHFINPYGGSIGARIEHWEPLSVRLCMPDRPWLRNPFKCIHAAALTNLAELASGAIVFAHLGKRRMKIIVKNIDITFEKKAVGNITAIAQVSEFPSTPGKHDLVLPVSLQNSAGVVVASAKVTWAIEILESKKGK